MNDPTACPVPPEDTERLVSQQARVVALMTPGRWWTLADLAHEVGASEAGVSARIRDLRKHPYRRNVLRQRVAGTTCYEYAVSTGETQ